MKILSDEEVISTQKAVEAALARNGIKQWCGDMLNPCLFEITIPVSTGEKKAVKTFNDIFHAIGVLPNDEQLEMSECKDYCASCVDEGGETYSATFNHPKAMKFKKGDNGYEFTLKAICEEQEAEAMTEEKEMQELIDGIKTGRLKSKKEDGYLVLMAEFYDDIEAGKKTVEYRDFTKYLINRTIGLKTIRFSRGTVKNAPQMRWEVKKVTLLDYEDNECDPFNVPDGFWPTTIAIHLGKRID